MCEKLTGAESGHKIARRYAADIFVFIVSKSLYRHVSYNILLQNY